MLAFLFGGVVFLRMGEKGCRDTRKGVQILYPTLCSRTGSIGIVSLLGHLKGSIFPIANRVDPFHDIQGRLVRMRAYAPKYSFLSLVSIPYLWIL